MQRKGFIFSLSDEIENNVNIHKALIRKIERATGNTIIVYMANFQHPAGAIMGKDADIIEDMIKSINTSDCIDLYIDSPGGLPYAATKIVKSLKADGKKLRTIVYRRAMSAATLICLGADELLMNYTGNLGPIDPQMEIGEFPNRRLVPAKVIIDSYIGTITDAQKAIAHQPPIPPDPFYVVLNRIDLNGVFESLKARTATNIIAANLLKQGLLKNNQNLIQNTVDKFVEAGDKELHGKHLFPDILQQDYNLSVNIIPAKSVLEQYLMELSIRLEKYILNRSLAKYILCNRGAIEMRVQLLKV